MTYLTSSVKVAFLSRDTQMTYVFSQGVNSQTRYQDSCSGPSQPWRYGATRLDCQSTLIRLGLLHLLGRENSRGSLKHSFLELSLSGSVKYLGVILDSLLTWREHLEVKVRKARNLLWDCRRACGMGWGLGPKVVH